MEPQLGHATTTNSFKKKTYAQPLMRNTMPPLTFHLFKLSGWPLTKPHFSIEATARSPCTLGNAQVTMRNLISPPKRQQETRDMLKNIMTR